MNNANGSNKRSELFLKLLMSNEVRIFSYILRLVPNLADAEDIMQETAGIMWRKFDQFQKATNFVAWAIEIAHYRVLDYRREKRRSPMLYESEIFEQMVSLAREAGQQDDRRLDALRRCLAKLQDRQRRLIMLRYYDGIGPKEIATRLGMSVHAVYKSLSRIYEQLLRCIRKTPAFEELR
ncbi:MAG TPA: sigma-70 family RNA polymerase sigma factor [Sedimentisphaerales bacterium]|nr:sigma-70 family RNA polymerase sigma factor [Sedimentisphaerales bacterium]